MLLGGELGEPNVVPFTQARAQLSELDEQAKAGAEKIITKNGESYVALIAADRLDYDHRLERERIHLLLINDAKRRLTDISVGTPLRQTQPSPNGSSPTCFQHGNRKPHMIRSGIRALC